MFDRPDPKTGAAYKIKAKGITMTLKNHNIFTPEDFLRVLVKNFDGNYPIDDPSRVRERAISLYHFHIALDHRNFSGYANAGERPMVAINTKKRLKSYIDQTTSSEVFRK